jgi:hypothetical protein
MDALSAAKSLADALRDLNGLVSVGVGKQGEKDCLYVYLRAVNRVVRKSVPGSWGGFPVVVRKMQSPRPARSDG